MPEAENAPVDKNGNPLKGALLAQWQAKHGGA
jgi:protocatechuate 3,4-dioxygenase beta subunit